MVKVPSRIRARVQVPRKKIGAVRRLVRTLFLAAQMPEKDSTKEKMVKEAMNAKLAASVMATLP